MGRATVVGGGTNGLFTVRVDYGKAPRDAMVFVLTLRINELTARIGEQTTKLALAQADTQAARVAAAQAVSDYASAVNADPGGGHADLISEVNRTTALLGRELTVEAGVRVPLDLLRADQAEQKRERGRLEAAVVEETRAAWCVDYTDEKDAGSEVATIEIPGENQDILIDIGCRPPGAPDGQLTAREIMSPAQAFWNAAVLPGWQKWKPTYRKGTITSIDANADLVNVDLDAAESSANRLNVNLAQTLAAVPVVYMTCHSNAFEIGDRVVVEFLGMDQASPRVIGFVDNPKPCDLVCNGHSANSIFSFILDAKGYDVFENFDQVTLRINGGPEISTAQHPITVDTSTYKYRESNVAVGAELSYPFIIIQKGLAGFNSKAYDVRIQLYVGPPYPPVNDGARNIIEVIVRKGAKIILNLAATDGGWSSNSNYRTSSAKWGGGFDYYAGAGIVTRLDYTLTNETP